MPKCQTQENTDLARKQINFELYGAGEQNDSRQKKPFQKSSFSKSRNTSSGNPKSHSKKGKRKW
jgi:hypothetical protein